MQLTRKLLCILCLMPYYAFAKCGSVNYSWGADSLATMHDYVVTMMLLRIRLSLCCRVRAPDLYQDEHR